MDDEMNHNALPATPIKNEALSCTPESTGWDCECGRRMVQPDINVERICCHHCGIEISKPNKEL